MTFIVFSFQDKVNAAKVSGNLDAPEGGFDAIMQAIACEVCDILYVKYTDNCCTVMELYFVTVNQLLFAVTLFYDLLVENLFTVTNLICCKDEDYQENEILETFLRTGLRCLQGSHEPRKKNHEH